MNCIDCGKEGCAFVRITKYDSYICVCKNCYNNHKKQTDKILDAFIEKAMNKRHGRKR